MCVGWRLLELAQRQFLLAIARGTSSTRTGSDLQCVQRSMHAHRVRHLSSRDYKPGRLTCIRNVLSTRGVLFAGREKLYVICDLYVLAVYVLTVPICIRPYGGKNGATKIVRTKQVNVLSGYVLSELDCISSVMSSCLLLITAHAYTAYSPCLIPL